MALWTRVARPVSKGGITAKPWRATQHQLGQKRGPQANTKLREKSLRFPRADASWASTNNTGQRQSWQRPVKTQRAAKGLREDHWDHAPLLWQQRKLPHLPAWGRRFWKPEHLPERDHFKPKEIDILLIGSFKVHVCFPAYPRAEGSWKKFSQLYRNKEITLSLYNWIVWVNL